MEVKNQPLVRFTRARVRLLGKPIERIYPFSAMLFRDAEAGPSRLFVRDAYLAAKRATTNRERAVAFTQERLAIVKARLGDVLL